MTLDAVCVAEAWVEKPSFGKSLEEHLNISGREIAFPIEACVTMLLECGMQEEVHCKHTCITLNSSVHGPSFILFNSAEQPTVCYFPLVSVG